jgi:hypothetical protein
MDGRGGADVSSDTTGYYGTVTIGVFVETVPAILPFLWCPAPPSDKTGRMSARIAHVRV